MGWTAGEFEIKSGSVIVRSATKLVAAAAKGLLLLVGFGADLGAGTLDVYIPVGDTASGEAGPSPRCAGP